MDEDPTMHDSDGEATTQNPKNRWQRNSLGERRNSSGLYFEDSDDEDVSFNSGRFNFGAQRNFFIHRWDNANMPYAPLRLVNDSGTHCWLSGQKSNILSLMNILCIKQLITIVTLAFEC